jgi:hypothetical protein
MSHAKDDFGATHGCFDLDNVLERGCHGLLTENVVSLRGERENDLLVHLVLDRNYYRVSKASTNGIYRLLGGRVEFLPGVEDQSVIDIVQVSETSLRLGTGLRNGHDFAEVCDPK